MSADNLYTPEFLKSERGEFYAHWVRMPDGAFRNIWDLAKHLDKEEIDEAIKNAFAVGFLACRMLLAENARMVNPKYGPIPKGDPYA